MKGFDRSQQEGPEFLFRKTPPYRIQRKATRWVGEDTVGGFIKLLPPKVCPAEGEKEIKY